jgi:hypothetical protein
LKKKKIVVICQEDKLWSLFAWNNVLKIPEIITEFDFVGFWNCEEKFVNIKQKDTWKWYLNTFGVVAFFQLGIFALFYKISLIYNSIFKGYSSSFESLCKNNNINHYKTNSPNSPDFIKWVKKNEIDILIIMVGHILQEEILAAPKICTINKHASLLPGNKGVFPYFWAYLKGEKQGVSFHVVNKAIDEGALAYQEKIEDSNIINSMVSFYFYCYKNYGKMLYKALKNIEKNSFANSLTTASPSYHSLPTIQDYSAFRKLNGKVITLTDLLLLFKFSQ